MLAQEWVRISDDLAQMGCAGFEVEGRKYVLYGVGETSISRPDNLEVDDE